MQHVVVWWWWRGDSTHHLLLEVNMHFYFLSTIFVYKRLERRLVSSHSHGPLFLRFCMPFLSFTKRKIENPFRENRTIENKMRTSQHTFHEEREFIDMYISCTFLRFFFLALCLLLCCTVIITTTIATSAATATKSTTPNRNGKKKIVLGRSRKEGTSRSIHWINKFKRFVVDLLLLPLKECALRAPFEANSSRRVLQYILGFCTSTSGR